MIRALVVGDNCLDCYGGEVETCYPGGNAVNVAVYLQRQGIATSYHGLVGDDALGRYLLAALAEEGVDLSLVETLPGRTGRTFVEIHGGERVFVGEDPGVQVPFHADLGPLGAGEYGLAHFSAFTSWEGGAQRCEPELAGELRTLKQTSLSVDFSDGETGESLFAEVGGLLASSFFSRPELTDDEVESFIRRCASRTPGAVIVTRGARGSAAGRSRGRVHLQPAPPVTVVDTLGAGDAFIAGFLAATARREGLASALQAGTALAGQVISHPGAWTNATCDRQSAAGVSNGTS